MASWQTPLCPFRIEFAGDKLDEIRIAVVDGFYAVPRGGVEIGGVLFGARKDGCLHIRDYRKIETEYLTGPSFHLSEADRAGLQKLVSETRFKDAEIHPVGWFHSHTRSAIHLSERDLELHRKYFPEPWQVALVLKPDHLGTVKGGYFFHQNDGLMNVTAEEFTVLPFSGEKQESAEEWKAEGELQAEPEAVAPVTAPEAPRAELPIFRSIASAPHVTTPKRYLWIAFAAASVLAMAAGYWVATH